MVGRGEGGGSGFAVTYLTFCQNFAVGSAEEVWEVYIRRGLMYRREICVSKSIRPA